MEPLSARKDSFAAAVLAIKILCGYQTGQQGTVDRCSSPPLRWGQIVTPYTLNFIKLYDIICNNVIAERPVLNFLFPFLPAFFLFSAAAIFHIIHGDMILPILSPARAGLEQ